MGVVLGLLQSSDMHVLFLLQSCRRVCASSRMGSGNRVSLVCSCAVCICRVGQTRVYTP